MAEQDKFQEPTEQPTPKRLKEARDKGQVPRSRELNTMAITLCAALAVYLFGESMMFNIAQLMADGLSLSRGDVVDTSRLLFPLEAATSAALQLLAPWLVLLSAVALLAPLALGGWSFSLEAMKFKGERINPIAGMKRLFSMRGLVEMLKAVAKFAFVGGIAILVLQWEAREFFALGRKPILEALAHSGWLISISFLLFSIGLIVIAAVDVPFQIWDHMKKLRMTRHEIKEEGKETEGRPEVRGRMRSLQQEVANRRMMEDIPIASVVVTNPTHFAVALRYEADEMDAPKVVAKGADHLAARIREVAQEHGVPIFEAPPLARALYDTSKVGDEIDEQLYVGVAQVLTYIYQLNQYMEFGGVEPDFPEVEAPAEYE